MITNTLKQPVIEQLTILSNQNQIKIVNCSTVITDEKACTVAYSKFIISSTNFTSLDTNLSNILSLNA